MDTLSMVIERAGEKELVAFFSSIIRSFDAHDRQWVENEKNKDEDFVRVLQRFKDLVTNVGSRMFHNEITQALWTYHQGLGGGSPGRLLSDAERCLWRFERRLEPAILAAAETRLEDGGSLTREDFWVLCWRTFDDVLERLRSEDGRLAEINHEYRLKEIKEMMQFKRSCGNTLREIMRQHDS